MGLMKKLFRGGSSDSKPIGGASTQFAESQIATSLDKTKSRNGPHRDLVKLMLRETMRKHGIPSDWIECRTLSVLTRQHKSGMHVQFLVRKSDQQLLPYVHAFQEDFWERILRTDPQARDWLFSVGWEFYGKAQDGFALAPNPATWDTGDDPERIDDDVASDLETLQALMSAPAELTNLPDAPLREHKAAD